MYTYMYRYIYILISVYTGPPVCISAYCGCRRWEVGPVLGLWTTDVWGLEWPHWWGRRQLIYPFPASFPPNSVECGAMWQYSLKSDCVGIFSRFLPEGRPTASRDPVSAGAWFWPLFSSWARPAFEVCSPCSRCILPWPAGGLAKFVFTCRTSRWVLQKELAPTNSLGPSDGLPLPRRRGGCAVRFGSRGECVSGERFSYPYRNPIDTSFSLGFLKLSGSFCFFVIQ